ncbi:AAA family ATPase [Spongiactinospora sp. TRM90649]|uniref:AAA family ATPase n=1 Tax=Spongiactinospora sp. TRM90649 TaxID=3031114 RepID=UPI0023F7ECE0|nr:AAA family ATPase [Spongiactinospora sp. TRM90649]MDF5751419.1 AAA family ATPase [Spongiactinospora sp. TRM90649]
MLVRGLTIENIKGFGEKAGRVSLSFDRDDGSLPRWIVIAGRNGAGKSSFLQAIALAIAGPSVARTLRETYADWIREGAGEGHATVHLKFSDVDAFAPGRKPNFDPRAGLKWIRQDEGPEPAIAMAPVKKSESSTPGRGPWAANPQGWFLAGYGPFRRLSLAPTEAQRLMMTPGRPAGLASLFREEASLSESVLWLQQLYLRRLEGSQDAHAVENAVLKLLDDGLLPEGMRVEKVTSEGLWVTTPDGISLPLRSLSDGYRTVAALVLDLVKKLYSVYGDLKEIEGEAIAFGHEGVVLIDEIDVHLHVTWQQRIGFWLKDHFPNLQFIVSTHSPFICQAADDRGLVRLSAPGENNGARIVEGELFNRVVNGTADDAVLTDLFGLETPYSTKTMALRSEAATLEKKAVAESISSTEKARLKDIKSKLPRTPSSDVADALNQLTLSFDDAED